MNPVVFAHRGASGYAPDNTIRSFNLAIQQGTKAIESDVKFTIDNKLIFFHDSAVKVRNLIPFPVSLLPFSYTSRMKLDQGQRVPKVEEVFHYYSVKGMLNELVWSLDIPGIPTFKALARLCKKFTNGNTIEACNSHYRFFSKWKSIMPEATMVWSIRKKMINNLGLGTVMKICRDRKVGVINLKCEDATWDMVDSVRKESLKLYIWDVHDKKRFEIAKKFKPDAIYSNYPDKALEGNW